MGEHERATYCTALQCGARWVSGLGAGVRLWERREAQERGRGGKKIRRRLTYDSDISQ